MPGRTHAPGGRKAPGRGPRAAERHGRRRLRPAVAPVADQRRREAEARAGVARSRLTRLHRSRIRVCMRTTLNLDADLLERARKLTGIKGKTALLHAGMEALIA